MEEPPLPSPQASVRSLPSVRCRCRAHKEDHIDYEIDDMVDFLSESLQNVIDPYSVEELEGDIEHLLFTSNVPKKFIFDAMDLMHKWLWLYAKIPVEYAVGIDVFIVCLKISKDYHHRVRYELADWAFCMGFGLSSLEYHEAHLLRFALWLAQSSEFAGCAISRRWKKAWKQFLKRRAKGKERAKTA